MRLAEKQNDQFIKNYLRSLLNVCCREAEPGEAIAKPMAQITRIKANFSNCPRCVFLFSFSFFFSFTLKGYRQLVRHSQHPGMS